MKGPLYARAETPEYWVVDIPEKLVHVHRLPTNGVYQNVRKYGFQEEIRPLAKPEAIFCAAKL